jgi:flagellin FlaB
MLSVLIRIGMQKLQIKQESKLVKNKFASMGIGCMIIFIAMILVAGIAASVLIQTSNSLETQALKTGGESRKEVSSGLRVLEITGQYGTRVVRGSSHTGVHNMTILVSSRPGSKAINLNSIVLTISNGSDKCVLTWNDKFADAPDGNGVYSTTNMYDCNGSEFGIIRVEDDDNSCTSDNPVINRGDKAAITVNISACFNALHTRTDVYGMLMVEQGAPGVFLFRTPPVSIRTVRELF